jgi:phage terminase small subunit
MTRRLIRKPKLTARQERFAAAYAGGKGSKESALSAGYSEASADSYASKLLRLPQVAARIDALLEKFRRAQDYDRDKALAELELARSHAIEQRSASAEVQAVRAKARLFGLEREVVEQAPAVPPSLGKEDRQRLALLARNAATAARAQGA